VKELQKVKFVMKGGEVVKGKGKRDMGEGS
jgi:hypothetical protein